MKIKCQYCGSMINDTLDHCPFCGGENPDVVRTSDDTPRTIEELQKWYSRHGLPPYETTRFFIGRNYIGPRAFGIYQDEQTGNFIVYKNKNSGERAIRYEGTDEAYAVNELYMRLKQEILQQKAVILKKNSTSSNRSVENSSSGTNSSGNIGKTLASGASSAAKGAGSILLSTGRYMLLITVLSIIIMVLVGVGVMLFDHTPDTGYYNYNGQYYYYFSNGESWFTTDKNGNWETSPMDYSTVPEDLKIDDDADPYYLSYDWSNALDCPNFEDSTYYKDWYSSPDVGYYHCDNNDYYNAAGSYVSGWYIFHDNDWESISSDEVPDELKHSDTFYDFYYTPTWDSSTQITDFEDSEAYAEYQDSVSSESDNDSDYSWSSSDSWDSGSSDFDSDW